MVDLQPDTKVSFKYLEWLLTLVGVAILSIVGWSAYQLYSLNREMAHVSQHVAQADAFHNKIPSAFFSSDRYTWDDELPFRQEVQEELSLLDKRIELQKQGLKAQKELSEIYSQMIRGLVQDHKKEQHK